MLKNLSPKGEKIWSSMKKQYGVKKGMEIFTAMEGEGKLKDVRVKAVPNNKTPKKRKP